MAGTQASTCTPLSQPSAATPSDEQRVEQNQRGHVTAAFSYKDARDEDDRPHHVKELERQGQAGGSGVDHRGPVRRVVPQQVGAAKPQVEELKRVEGVSKRVRVRASEKRDRLGRARVSRSLFESVELICG